MTKKLYHPLAGQGCSCGHGSPSLIANEISLVCSQGPHCDNKKIRGLEQAQAMFRGLRISDTDLTDWDPPGCTTL